MKILLLLFLSIVFAIHAQEPLLILNAKNEEVLPYHYRACWDPFKILEPNLPTRKGLENLNISGSAQFSQLSLKAIINRVVPTGPFYVVDLRQESHGFLNGDAVSWFIPKDWINKGKTDQEIALSEKQLLDNLKQQKEVTLTTITEKDNEGGIADFTKLQVAVQTVLSEKEVADLAKVGYFRLYIPDHLPPSSEKVDSFIAFFLSLPSNAWIHLHCAAGDGRTTTFMALVDMLHNAKKVSFEEIIRRQFLLGGIDLTHLGNPSHWKYPLAKERLEFLKRFYTYAKTNTDGFKTAWSSYQ